MKLDSWLKHFLICADEKYDSLFPAELSRTDWMFIHRYCLRVLELSTRSHRAAKRIEELKGIYFFIQFDQDRSTRQQVQITA